MRHNRRPRFARGATRTWQHRDTGIIWFNDLLPDLLRSFDVDTARIWTFGYPANIAFQTSTIHSFAQNLLHSVSNVRRGRENRKIIWVCHSLGGIIVKKALIDASIDPAYKSIPRATSGMVFLGTPHRGSAVADIGTIAANIAGVAIPGFRIFNRDLLNDLRRNSNTLVDISSSFSRICASIKIHSFFETIPQGAQLVVDRTSAVLDMTNEVVRCGLNSNHQDMGKFRDQNDSNWVNVANSIMELVRTANQNPGHPSQSHFNSYPTPPPPRRPPQQPQQPPQPPPPRQSGGGGQPPPRQNGWGGTPPSGPSTARGQPSSAYPTLNTSHSRMSLRPESQGASQSSPQPSRKPSPASTPASTPRPPNPGDPEAAICDACMGSIRGSDPRVQCTVCYDYDLCLGCYERGRVSKSHNTSHEISFVSYTEIIGYDDLVPVSEAVNPQSFPAPDGRINWTVKDLAPGTAWNKTKKTISYRLLHLYEKNSHARFLAYCKPGHYGVAMDIGLEFDKSLGAQNRQVLKTRAGKAGTLRVSIGKVKNQQEFFRTKFEPEETISDGTLTPSSLPSRLLEPGFWAGVRQIGVDQHSIILQSDRVLRINRSSGASVPVGVILQWSGVANYPAPDKDPVVSLNVGMIRLYNLVNYSEPYIRAFPPPELTFAPDPAPDPAEREEEERSEADQGPSVEEFLEALIQIQREQQSREERERMEALMRAQLQRQEQAKREAIAALYIRAAEEAIKEAIVEEQKRREQEELIRVLRALGLVQYVRR